MPIWPHCGTKSSKIVECPTFGLLIYARNYLKIHKIDQISTKDNIGMRRMAHWPIIIKFLISLCYRTFNSRQHWTRILFEISTSLPWSESAKVWHQKFWISVLVNRNLIEIHYLKNESNIQRRLVHLGFELANFVVRLEFWTQSAMSIDPFCTKYGHFFWSIYSWICVFQLPCHEVYGSG